MAYILGLSYNYHDAAAVLLKDGVIVAASTEERHTRRKHDPDFPMMSIATCLELANITAREIDWVAYYEQPLVKFGRILDMSVRHWHHGGQAFLRSSVEAWAAKGKFDVRHQISHLLAIPEDRIRFCEHHLSHAASAFFCSPFTSATIVTLDGAGEWETCTISLGANNSIRKIESVRLPHSLGIFYSALTAFLGFEVNEGEYKVMGMAGFGRPIYEKTMLGWFDLRRGGGFRIKEDVLAFDDNAELTYNHALVETLGPPRKPDSPFAVGSESEAAFGTAQHYANVAASMQAATEAVIEHVAREALRRTAVPSLCLAGGVALNSTANQRLRRVLGVPMFVQPAAGDAGGALGAAKWMYHGELGGRAREPMITVALGSSVSAAAIVTEVREHFARTEWEEYPDDQGLIDAVADLLAAGKVVGWVQGRSEWGPRSLGYRSILADPRRSEMQAIVNEKIKFREPFRPFAPAVIEEYARTFFDLIDIAGEDPATNPYNFMLAVCSVRPEAAARIPAVTHVDNSARVQVVRAEVNPLFYRLIEAFGLRTGVPVLLNTSFNLRGEPIVDSVKDAIATFEWSGMDNLAVGPVVIKK